MKSINQEISRWIDDIIIPRYDAFDKGHQRDHAQYVIKTALELSLHYDVNRDMIAVAAACHGLGPEDTEARAVIAMKTMSLADLW